MNHYYIESRGKQKINKLIKEGRESQAYYRSGATKPHFLSKIPKIIYIVLGILGLILINL
jgi:hypothetical protein